MPHAILDRLRSFWSKWLGRRPKPPVSPVWEELSFSLWFSLDDWPSAVGEPFVLVDYVGWVHWFVVVDLANQLRFSVWAGGVLWTVTSLEPLLPRQWHLVQGYCYRQGRIGVSVDHKLYVCSEDPEVWPEPETLLLPKDSFRAQVTHLKWHLNKDPQT